MMHKIAVIIIAAVAGSTLGIWASQREPCYTVVSGNPIPNPARVGDAIDLQLVLDVKISGCSGYYTRVIEQPGKWIRTTKRLPMAFSVLPVGVRQTHSVEPFIVPSGIDGETIIMYSVMEFYRNPLQAFLNWPVVHTGARAQLTVLKEPTTSRPN